MAIDLREVGRCLECLRALHGIPPHDNPNNICRSDPFFSKSIEQSFPPEIRKLAEELVKKEQKVWDDVRARFITERKEPV